MGRVTVSLLDVLKTRAEKYADFPEQHAHNYTAHHVTECRFFCKSK